MEQNEIIEGNKLIALFMGWKEMAHTKLKDWIITEIIESQECTKKQCALHQLKFHSSWDWLMPVGKKIFDWL
jgi:hypothetical protein